MVADVDVPRPPLDELPVEERRPAAALPVAERRRTERDLLAHYLDRLRARDIEPPAGASVERGIRLGILHGFYLWGITQMVHPSVTRAMLERMGTAAADHDAFSSVQV